MKLLLSENLRNLRVSHKLTQEQLAEALGVSPQAVSRWENGAALPDISFLPIIANFYEVTSDYLLGIDVTTKKARIKEIINKDVSLRSSGKTKESIAFLREKAKEYPNCSEILHRLACSLFSLYHQSGEKLSDTEKDQMAREAVFLCRQAVKYSDSLSFICRCYQTLILNLVHLKEYNEAVEIAGSLPSFWCSREIVFPKACGEREEALKENQNFLIELIVAVVTTMGRIKSCDDYSDSQKIKLADVREMLIIMLAGENPCFLNEYLFELSMIRAKIYLSQGNKDKLNEEINKLIKYAKNYDQREENGKFNVFWLSQCRDNKCNETKHTSLTLSERLKDFAAENHIEI